MIRWPLNRRQWLTSLALGTATSVALVAFLATGHEAGAGVVLAWPVLFRFAPFARLNAEPKSSVKGLQNNEVRADNGGMNTNENPAPHVVKTTTLRAYPGWEISHNETTGFYWANDTRGIAIGPGEVCFADALFFVKNGRPPFGDELANA